MSDGEMSRREDDASLPILAHRLSALEKRVDDGFKHLEHRLDKLDFVRAGEFAVWKIGLEKEQIEMKDDITDAAKPGKWALALFASTLFAAIVGIVVQVAFRVSG